MEWDNFDFLTANDAASGWADSMYIPTSTASGPTFEAFAAPVSDSISWPSLTDATNFIKSGVDWGLGVQQQIYSTQARAEDAEFQRLMKTLQLDVARTQATTGAEVAKTQSVAELAMLKSKIEAAQGAQRLISNVASGKSNDTIMLLTILGVGFAALQLMKAK